MSHRFFTVPMLSIALLLPFAAQAEQTTSPAPADTKTAEPAAMPAGPGMGMRYYMQAMPGEGARCNTRKMSNQAGSTHCMSGKCPHAANLEQRIDSMEKRLDMMQLTLEMLVRQQGAAAK